MTPDAVIDRLCDVLPRVIAPFIRGHERCIAATRVGIDVLRHYHIVATPLVVDVRAFNPAAVQWFINQQPGGAAEFERRGCYYSTTVDDDIELSPLTGSNFERTPAGHLVVHVPSRCEIIDFDMRAIARPEFDLYTPAAYAMPWDGREVEMACENGARLVYSRRVDPRTGLMDRTWEDARDWQPADALTTRVLDALT